MAETAQEYRLRPIEKIGYGLGDTASNLVFQTVILFLAYFYTDIFGISAAAMGTLFLVVRILDAITDPLMGMLCDHTETRWGKFRPYLLWLCLPFAIIYVITFTTPDLSPQGKLIYAYITYSLLMIVYTSINIPYCALGGVLTPDTRERVSLNGYRFFLATAGGVLVASATLPLTKALGQGVDQKGFQLATTFFSVLAVFLFVACFFMTKERVTQATSTQGSLRKDLKLLFANDQFLVVALLNFVLLIPLVIRGSTAAFYMKWYAQREDLIAVFVTTGMVAMMLGAGCARTLTKYLSKVKAYMLIQILTVVFSASLFFLKPGQLTLMFVLFAAVQFFVQMGAPILWAMMADTVDYGEYKTKRRMTGLVFSGSLFSLKMGVALGGAMLGWVLAHYGYQEGEVAEQTPATIRGIALIFTLIPAAIHLPLIGLVNLYKLDQNRCDQIKAALDERRHTASTETRANSEM